MGHHHYISDFPGTQERADLPQVPSRLDWFLQRSDDILARYREFATLMNPSFQVLPQRLPGDGESVPINQLVLQQVMQDHCTSHERN